MKVMQLMAFAVIAIFLISIIPSGVAEDNKRDAGIKVGKWREKAKNFLENEEFRQQLKQKIQLCKANESAENCTEVRTEAIEVAKEVLSAMIERLEQHLANIKEKVEASEKLIDKEKADLIAAIEQQKAKLDEIKTKFEEADTFAELKQIAKELRSLAQAIKYKAINLVKMRRIGLIIQRATHLETKLNATLERLEKQRYNVSELQRLVDDFKEKIDAANSLYAEARELWDKFYEMVAAGEIEGRAKIMQEANGRMKEAQNYLKEAHVILKEIVQKLREVKTEKPKGNETAENETNLSN